MYTKSGFKFTKFGHLFTKEYLEQKLVIENMTMVDLAKLHNTKKTTVSYYVYKFEIKLNRPSNLLAVGQKHKMFTIIEKKIKQTSRGKHTVWVCKCDCGNECEFTSYILVKGKVKSCGCLNKGKNHKNWSGCGEIHGENLNGIRMSAERRGLEYSVSKEYLMDLYLKQNRKCALSGIEIKFGQKYHGTETTASLDRINNDKGYIEGNVQWLHKAINWMKQDYTQEEFIEYCSLVTRSQQCESQQKQNLESHMLASL